MRGISFTVARGETFCIVGKSGCGKSLTSLAIMDLLPARAMRRAKRLAFGKTDLARLSERKMGDLRGNKLAMIFQDPMTSLNPSYTIGNQLEEALLRHRAVSVRMPATAPSSCSRRSASPRRRAVSASIRISSRAGCASAS